MSRTTGARVAVENIAAAGVVHITRAVVGESVIAGVVESSERDCRTEFVAFAGMVEDDVENDFEPGVVKPGDSFPHFTPAARREARVGRHHGDGIVAPVIGKPERRQVTLVDPRRARQKLQRRDAEPRQMRDRRVMRETGEGPAQMLRNVGMRRGETLDVKLIDDRIAPGMLWPRRLRRDWLRDNRFRQMRGAVDVRGVAISEERRMQREGAIERQRIRIDEQFRRIEAMAGVRRIGSIGAKAIALAFFEALDIAVKNVAAARGQFYAGDLFVGVIEETKLDRLGVSGKHRDIRAARVRRDAERLRRAIGEAAAHAPALPSPSCPRLSRASTRSRSGDIMSRRFADVRHLRRKTAWMAGTRPAMT